MISIIVPTLGRPAALGPLIDSVRMTTPVGEYELVFVVDPDDAGTHRTLHAFPGLDVRIVVGEGTYPRKTNLGYEASEGDLVLPTADDVSFHPRWFLNAVDSLEPNTAVLGTNDLSPATETGQHATMPIIRRSYIEGPGAVLDEPGLIFWEGYHHNFCETELWQLAVSRGVAKFDSAVVIEHLHPDWGKRAEDATDQRGCRAAWDEDEALFARRAAVWAGD